MKKLTALILCFALSFQCSTITLANDIEDTKDKDTPSNSQITKDDQLHIESSSDSNSLQNHDSKFLNIPPEEPVQNSQSEDSMEITPNETKENHDNSIDVFSLGEWIYENETWYYSLSNGSYAKGWHIIDGTWYFFHPDGAMATGWQYTEGKWYYFLPYGAMTTGWLEEGGQKYYLHSNGAMATGFVNLDGTQYYFNSSGAMVTGWTMHNNYWYYFLEDGSMETGWLNLNNEWYHLKDDGKMSTGWIYSDYAWFYLKSNGTMATGWVYLNGNRYYLDPSGVMASDWTYINGSWYYFYSNGALATGWIQLDGSWYYLYSDGAMATDWIRLQGKWYYLQSSGVMATDWIELNGTWYYLYSNGEMATGWIKLNHIWYYLYPSGAMASNITIDGYRLKYNGECLNRVKSIPGGRIINVPYISQKNLLPTGCETVSATMLLRYYGNSTSIDEFVDKHLTKRNLQYINGKTYGPTPDEAFIGNPRSSSGFGCYPPVIERALNSILWGNSRYSPKITTGTSLDSLITEYIDKDIPVLLWATINMLPSYSGMSWYTRPNDEIFTWTAQEHCLVLVGYDDSNYYFNDPYNSNGLIGYRKELVRIRFQELGMRSLVLN